MVWQDSVNATDHYDDLMKVRARVDAEPLADFYNADECKAYRLKTIDKLIELTVLEMSPKDETPEHFK